MDARRPVLAGVGTSFADAEAVELMVEATRAAGADAGAAGLLAATQRIVVPRGTWSYRDPARIVAERIGAPHATTVLVDVGIPQQTMLDEVMAAMLAGDLDVAVVVGGEAKARSARIGRQRTRGDTAGMARVFSRGGTDEATATEIDQGDVRPDIHQQPVGDLVDAVEIEAGLWAPVEQYALIESALAAHEQVSPPALRREIADLYQRFNQVARSNPDAAFPEPMAAEQLATFSSSNRPLAFPYAKWHASQWTVDQASAVLLCTAAAADRFGVPIDRRVHPVVGLSSSHMVPVSRRRDLHRWPAMHVLGAAAEEHLGHRVADCRHVELYSCFPSAVRVQQRELGVGQDRTPTFTGGMAFAGGPFNSYVLQSMATMVERLREEGGRAMVTSVSGLLTKPGLAIWSAEPDAEPPLLGDLATAAAADTRTVPVVASHEGVVRVAACTVTYEGLEPAGLVALLDTPDGERVIARSSDAALMDRAITEGLVGTDLHLAGGVVHD